MLEEVLSQGSGCATNKNKISHITAIVGSEGALLSLDCVWSFIIIKALTTGYQSDKDNYHLHQGH